MLFLFSRYIINNCELHNAAERKYTCIYHRRRLFVRFLQIPIEIQNLEIEREASLRPNPNQLPTTVRKSYLKSNFRTKKSGSGRHYYGVLKPYGTVILKLIYAFSVKKHLIHRLMKGDKCSEATYVAALCAIICLALQKYIDLG